MWMPCCIFRQMKMCPHTHNKKVNERYFFKALRWIPECIAGRYKQTHPHGEWDLSKITSARNPQCPTPWCQPIISLLPIQIRAFIIVIKVCSNSDTTSKHIRALPFIMRTYSEVSQPFQLALSTCDDWRWSLLLLISWSDIRNLTKCSTISSPWQ